MSATGKWPTGENDPRYKQEFKMPKWNRRVTPLDVPKLLHYVFPELTKQDHERLAREYIRAANMFQGEWEEGVKNALAQYGSHGSLISGVVREHFPQWVKESLRNTARRASRYAAMAWAHWKAAGKRSTLPGVGRGYGA